MKKRLLSVLLAVLMIVSLLPSMAFASEVGCTHTQKVTTITDGETYQMNLSGKNKGSFTFEASGKNWNIKNSSGKYLNAENGKLVLGSSAKTAWTYSKGAFSISEKTTQKNNGYWWGWMWIPGWGTKTVTTTYYLSTVTSGKLSTGYVGAELFKTVSGEHDYGKAIYVDQTNHKYVCKNCGDVKTEAHSYDKTTHKCVCGAYDPAESGVKISVDVKEKTTKQFVGWWFWGTWKNITTYTATIKTEAKGVKVTKVQYQLNGGRWTNGTCVSSDKPIESLKVKAWDNTGKLYEYEWPEEPAPILTPVDAPEAATGFIYNGQEQTGVTEATGYTVTNGKASGAGSYTATATLAEGYKWSDDTTVAKQIDWSIAKAALTATADEKTVTVGDEAPAYTITYTGWVNGESIETVIPTTAAELSCGYTTSSPAGDYDITFTTEPVFANYDVTTANGKLTAAPVEMATVNIYVYDETASTKDDYVPVIGATATFTAGGSDYSATTDSYGFASLKVPKNVEGTWTVSATGYKTLTQNATYTSDAYDDFLWIEQDQVKVSGVTLDKTEVTIEVGDEDVKLTATVLPENATNKSVTWSSSNNDVATVDNEGKVHAVAAGNATITVTTVDGEKTDTCAVKVVAPAPAAPTFKAVYNTKDSANTLTFYYDTVDHSGENITVYDNLPTAATKQTDWGYNGNRSNIKSVVIDDSVADYKGLTSTTFMFQAMTTATSISGAEYLDVSNVTDMAAMFWNFGSKSSTLNSVPDVKDWNTGSVTNMQNMFMSYGAGSEGFNAVPDVKDWNTASVTNMNSMFESYGESSKNLNKVPDVSKWNTSSVTDMGDMFLKYGYKSTALNTVPDVSGWNTSSVTTMTNMFQNYGYSSNALSTVPNVSNWKTGNVTRMTNMFNGYGYTSTNISCVLDLSGWDLSIITSGDDVFNFKPSTFNVTIPAKTGEKSNEGDKWYYGDGTNFIAPPEGKNFTPTAPKIKYMDWDADKKELVEKSVLEDATTEVTSTTTTLEAGKFYVVKGNVETGMLRVNGTDANPTTLIICDGAMLTATSSGSNAAIRVESGNNLVITGQSKGTGKLNAKGQSYDAGIGGGYNDAGGTVTINGGIVTATGGTGGAGIGGGCNGAGGTVTINGGTITATGGSDGAGIGGGWHYSNSGAGGTVTINGGTVTAKGYEAIGKGKDGTESGTVTFGEGVNFTINAGADEDHTESKTTAEYSSNHSAAYVSIEESAAPATYSVTYNANGATSGTAPAAQTKIQDEVLTLATNTGSLAKTGYSFAGWNTASDGTGTHYDAGASYTSNADLTLYAEWVKTVADVLPEGFPTSKDTGWRNENGFSMFISGDYLIIYSSDGFPIDGMVLETVLTKVEDKWMCVGEGNGNFTFNMNGDNLVSIECEYEGCDDASEGTYAAPAVTLTMSVNKGVNDPDNEDTMAEIEDNEPIVEEPTPESEPVKSEEKKQEELILPAEAMSDKSIEGSEPDTPETKD